MFKALRRPHYVAKQIPTSKKNFETMEIQKQWEFQNLVTK